jgi:hypothetical protein
MPLRFTLAGCSGPFFSFPMAGMRRWEAFSGSSGRRTGSIKTDCGITQHFNAMWRVGTSDEVFRSRLLPSLSDCKENVEELVYVNDRVSRLSAPPYVMMYSSPYRFERNQGQSFHCVWYHCVSSLFLLALTLFFIHPQTCNLLLKRWSARATARRVAISLPGDMATNKVPLFRQPSNGNRTCSEPPCGVCISAIRVEHLRNMTPMLADKRAIGGSLSRKQTMRLVVNE